MIGKTEVALRIIAGVGPAWAHWKLFFGEKPVPERDKQAESAQAYQDRFSAIVRLEACSWLAKRLNAEFKPEPDFWVNDSTMDDGPEPVYLEDEAPDEQEYASPPPPVGT